MAKTPKKPKSPISDPMIDLFAESPTAARRRPGRRSNHETAGAGIAAKPKKATNQPNHGTIPANFNNIDDIDKCSDIRSIDVLDDIGEIIKSIDLKGRLTQQEAIFIENHIVLGKNRILSMKIAGYEESCEGTYYYKARKIIQKFEGNEEDHRNIMRALGAGEVFVIDNLIKLAKHANSEIVKANALNTLGKWLGMDKETLQGAGGITIVMQAYDGSKQQVNVGTNVPPPSPGTPTYQHPQPGKPGQPITITR